MEWSKEHLLLQSLQVGAKSQFSYLDRRGSQTDLWKKHAGFTSVFYVHFSAVFFSMLSFLHVDISFFMCISYVS